MAWKKTRLSVHPYFWLWIALLFVMVPIRFRAAFFTAVFFHEVCHMIALKMFRYPMIQVAVGFSGIKIYTAELQPIHEIICALAGPLGGFTLILFAELIPSVALFGCLQSLYNLLPLYPMDGGRVVSAALRMFLSKRKADAICTIIQYTVILMIITVLLMLCVRFQMGIGTIIFGICLLFPALKRKYPLQRQPLQGTIENHIYL